MYMNFKNYGEKKHDCGHEPIDQLSKTLMQYFA